MSIVDVFKSGVGHVLDAPKVVVHTIEGIPNEVRSALQRVWGLPSNFIPVIKTCPEFARRLVDAVSGLPASAFEPLRNIPMERWNAALTAVVTDKNLLNDIKAAEAGDKAAEQRSRSTLERIASAMLGVTEGGFAIAGMFLGVAGALAAGGVAGIPFTFGISEIPAVAVAVAGIVALALSGALGLVGEILNAIG